MSTLMNIMINVLAKAIETAIKIETVHSLTILRNRNTVIKYK